MALLNRDEPSALQRDKCLITAAAYHLHVADVAAKTFPGHINGAEVRTLMEECRELIRGLVEDGV